MRIMQDRISFSINKIGKRREKARKKIRIRV